MIASPTTYAARFIVRRTKRAAPVPHPVVHWG